MKKHFLTGLILILPFILTLTVLNFFVKLLTKPFLGITNTILNHSIGLRSPELTTLVSEMLILIFLFFALVLVGFLGHLFLSKALFSACDALMRHIPLVNTIYKTIHEFLNNIFGKNRHNFSQAVLVPFPHAQARAIGFITRESLPIQNETKENALISVFLPGTPYPMMGFTLKLPRQQITPLNMPLEDALKFVISCGAINKP